MPQLYPLLRTQFQKISRIASVIEIFDFGGDVKVRSKQT
jgi:hypothetical protein